MENDAFIFTEYQGSTKIQSLLNSLTEAIVNGKFTAGRALPSINELARVSGYSKDTVVKVYHILKERSLVESVPAKGFFVTGQLSRVFMLLDDFSAFKEQLYQSFRANIPASWSVDLLFHHYNPSLFEQMVRNAAGRYSMYVIMNLSNRFLHPVLSKIDPNKLLILDMGTDEKSESNFLLQNFDQAVVDCLLKSISVLRKYNKFILIYSHQKTPHPPETEKALRRFCQTQGFEFSVCPEFDEKKLEKGQVYFVIKEDDLVEVVQSCDKHEFVLGREVGVLAYNDTPMKRIAGNGITTLSVDFREMGEKAAAFVTKKHKIREFLPTSLIIRNSL
jgi:DNA-binding transcriptional regulator YhcF (GntR family)